MISTVVFNEDVGTEKPTMIIDEQCEVKLMLDDEMPGILYLIFETLDERAVITLEVNPDKRVEACEVLVNALEKIGDLADEEE